MKFGPKMAKSRVNQTRVDRDKPRNLDFGALDLWTLDFFYGLRMTQDYQLDHSLSQRLLNYFFDNVLLEHVGLIQKILETAQTPNSSFHFLCDLGLGLGTWTRACQSFENMR